MAIDPAKIQQWRSAAQQHADLATNLVQALPDNPGDVSERDYSKIAMTASLSAMYYAAALDADHFGDAPT